MTVTFVVILNTDIMTSQGRRAVYNNKTPYMQNMQYTNQHNHQYFLPFNKFSIFQASFQSNSNIIVKSVPSLVTKNKFTVKLFREEKRLYSHVVHLQQGVDVRIDILHSGCCSIIRDIYLARASLTIILTGDQATASCDGNIRNHPPVWTSTEETTRSDPQPLPLSRFTMKWSIRKLCFAFLFLFSDAVCRSR